MSDIDGEPMEDSDLESSVLGGDEEDSGKTLEQETKSEEPPPTENPEGAPAVPLRKPRPRAEDMFADSDSD
jgi:U2-associated protein SR140